MELCYWAKLRWNVIDTARHSSISCIRCLHFQFVHCVFANLLLYKTNEWRQVFVDLEFWKGRVLQWLTPQTCHVSASVSLSHDTLTTQRGQSETIQVQTTCYRCVWCFKHTQTIMIKRPDGCHPLAFGFPTVHRTVRRGDTSSGQYNVIDAQRSEYRMSPRITYIWWVTPMRRVCPPRPWLGMDNDLTFV